jgi:hypothetical protein
MKEYKFSITNKMLATGDGFGAFGNSLMMYAVSQANEKNPSFMVTGISYKYVPDDTVEEGTHEWTMKLMNKEELLK